MFAMASFPPKSFMASILTSLPSSGSRSLHENGNSKKTKVTSVQSSDSIVFRDPVVLFQASADFQKHLEDGTPFPIIFTPNDNAAKSLISVATENRDWLDSILAESGGIVFRGFDINSVEDFNSFIEALGWEEYNYQEKGGRAVRSRVFKRVSTVNENIPMDRPIGLHSEACYLEEFPTRVIFFCEVPPEPGTGGETPIAHGHSIYKKMFEKNKSLVDEFFEKGIKFIGKSSEFPRFPAFREDRVGRISWFNQFGTYTINLKEIGDVGFGDGRLVPKEQLEFCLQILEEEKVKIPWQKGDIVMLDNTAALHGREACNGPVRSICLSLTK